LKSKAPEPFARSNTGGHTSSASGVGVLIVNRNKRDYVLRALECVRASTHPLSGVVVVDDCSTDDSVPAVRREFPDVEIRVAEGQRGAPGVRNEGIRALLRNPDVGYVLFLDNDAFVQPDAVALLVEAAVRDATIGVVAPKAFRDLKTRLLYSAGELRVNLYTGITHDVGSGEIDHGQFDEERDIQACASFAMLVRREVLETAGGFDEAFFPYGWEDVDFTLRARRHGYRIRYIPAAEVEHLGGKVGRGMVPEYEAAKTKNLFLLMARHATLLQWTCFLIVFPWRAAFVAGKQIRAGGIGNLFKQLAKLCQLIKQQICHRSEEQGV